MKRILVAAVLVLMAATCVFADNADLGIMSSKTFLLNLDVAPYVGADISVIFDLAIRNQNILVDHKGDMTNVGDYETREGSKTSTVIGLGYAFGSITPWAGVSSQSEIKTKVEVKRKEDKNVKETENLGESASGLAFGINFDHWEGSLGISGTLAKVPTGVAFDGGIKYRFAGIWTAHAGYSYRGKVGQGVIIGFGVSY